MRKIFPTEDETSIDPRVLRKNKELLKENLQLIESMKDSSKELKEVDAALKEYEEARKKRMDMINATADESQIFWMMFHQEMEMSQKIQGNKMTKMLMKNSMTTIRMMAKVSKYQDTI